MTKIYFPLAALCLFALPVFGQTSLAPRHGYDVAPWLPEHANSGAFVFSDTLFYLNEGDTIRKLGIHSGSELNKYGKPQNYTGNSYATFLALSPDGSTLWAGYTSDGAADDRIYSIEVETGAWEWQATFPGNMDLCFWNDSILVSGLNSSSWDAPSAIFSLDTSGDNKHRRLIEPGGYSAGMALDQQNNLYYGTSYAADPNVLYRWDSSIVQQAIESPDGPVLQVSDGEKLSDLPGGVYDCEIDEGGNVLLNMNLYGGVMALCKWNGSSGDGINLDTLATASGEYDWLGNLKSKGDITLTEPGNMIVTYSFGQPLAKITRLNTVGAKVKLSPEILVYPNPSRGFFTIHTENAELLEVQVFTMQGSLVYDKRDFVSGELIDLSNQAAGAYILRVKDDIGASAQLIHIL